MILSTRTATRGAVAAAAVVALAAGASVATAQVPGDGHLGQVVNTDSNALLVTVNDKGENPTTVSGAIENTTANNFRCATPGPDIQGEFTAGQVTTAEVVSEVIGYYQANVYTGPDGFALPTGGIVSLGSLQELLPSGSAALGSATIDSRTAHQEARVAGRTGTPQVGNQTVFTVTAGNTVNWSAVLGVPATGDRGEWQAAAMFYCVNQSTGAHYIFYGYEPIPEPVEPEDPEVPDDPEGIESLGGAEQYADTGRIAAGSLG